jgi:two-component sensor histidine kinase
VEAVYEPVDLRALTRDLASGFRSAVERAGLAFRFESDELAEPAFVDRGMWEKIVLNLLSNAFKFTFQGEISVTLRQGADHYELAVRTPASAFPKTSGRTSSSGSGAWRASAPGRTKARGSAWPWCRSWRACTGARPR